MNPKNDKAIRYHEEIEEKYGREAFVSLCGITPEEEIEYLRSYLSEIGELCGMEEGFAFRDLVAKLKKSSEQ